jgi:hypothetical protein
LHRRNLPALPSNINSVEARSIYVAAKTIFSDGGSFDRERRNVRNGWEADVASAEGPA